MHFDDKMIRSSTLTADETVGKLGRAAKDLGVTVAVFDDLKW